MHRIGCRYLLACLYSNAWLWGWPNSETVPWSSSSRAFRTLYRPVSSDRDDHEKENLQSMVWKIKQNAPCLRMERRIKVQEQTHGCRSYGSWRLRVVNCYLRLRICMELKRQRWTTSGDSHGEIGRHKSVSDAVASNIYIGAHIWSSKIFGTTWTSGVNQGPDWIAESSRVYASKIASWWPWISLETTCQYFIGVKADKSKKGMDDLERASLCITYKKITLHLRVSFNRRTAK
jgi:hypothetical protein